MSDAPDKTVRRLPVAAADVLESLHQHRLLTVAQIKALHMPRCSPGWPHRVLGELRRRGLADSVPATNRAGLWFITATGADTVEALAGRVETRRRISSVEQAAGPLRNHTLALNDAAIAFVAAARGRGDECGPLSWRHEIAHRIAAGGPRGPAGLLIADALLSYLQIEADGSVILHQRFIELDRGTTPPDQLAGKLGRYTLLHDQLPTTQEKPRPDWRTSYRVFPQVLVVIAGLNPEVTLRRIQRVIALYRTDPQTRTHTPVPVSFTALCDLAAEGPFAAVFISADKPGRYCDWLGQTSPQPQQERRNPDV